MIKLRHLLLEKTLYHGTIIDFVPDIEAVGLVPSVGEFVKNAYDMSGYGEDINPDDYLEELIFATDKEQLGKAATAITAQIAAKFNKDFHDVTDDEFVRYGAIAVIKDGDYAMKQKGEDEHDDHPYTVEPGDYYSRDNIPVDYVLTGDRMLTLLKRYGEWPRIYQFNKDRIKGMKYHLIRLAIKLHPEKTPKDIVNIINSYNDRKVEQLYYQNVRK